MKNNQKNTPEHNKAQSEQQGGTTSDRAFKDVLETKKHSIPNSGGQMSHQTDNKQGNVNKGNQNPNVQGKKQAPATQSQSRPKKK